MKKLAVAVALSLMSSTCFAMPTGENVRSGDANFSRVNDVLTINQNTGKVAIDWSSFNVGKNEVVKFNQNGGIALNRILSSDASSIFGKLQSDGTVVLVNPNGIIFGDGCVINTGAIVASTATLSDDFMTNFNTMNVDMDYYKDALFTYVPDENGNVVNINNVVKADHIEVGTDGKIYLKSSGDVDISGKIDTTNFTAGGKNVTVESGTINNTGTLNLAGKRNVIINSPITSTSNINLYGDFDKDFKGLISVSGNISSENGSVNFVAPTTGTYIGYPNNEGKISAENGDTTFYGNVAVNNSKVDITTKNFLVTGNVDSANSYKVYLNTHQLGSSIKDNEDIKALAKAYYQKYLKDVVYKSFEDLTEDEYNAIKSRCMDEYSGYNHRTKPAEGSQAEIDAVKSYFNSYVKIKNLTSATDFDNLTEAQYTQLANNILSSKSYAQTGSRESILNNWYNALEASKEGTDGDSKVGSKYLTTITDSLENWRVTSLLENKDYELFLGGKTDIVGKNVKDGREFRWYTGIEGDKGNTKFFTSSGVGEGTTHTYSAWSIDPDDHRYKFEEPNNNGNYDQPYVAIGWHKNNGNGWADVDNLKNTVKGFVQETNNERSTINVTLTGEHNIQGKVGDSVPITVNYQAPTPVEPDPTPIEPDPTPIEPDPTPVNPDPTPIEPDPTPVNPDPTPVEPDPTPVNPDPVPVEPDPAPVNPDPVPVEPTPTIPKVNIDERYLKDDIDKHQSFSGVIITKSEKDKKSTYGVYNVDIKDNKTSLLRINEYSSTKSVEVVCDHHELIKTLSNNLECKLVWNGSVLNIYPVNENAKALKGKLCNEDVASDALQVAYSDMRINMNMLSEICIHVD